MRVHYIMQIIATVCMFLAGKVEETPRTLKEVIILSYKIIHKKDPASLELIKQKVRYLNFSESIDLDILVLGSLILQLTVI